MSFLQLFALLTTTTAGFLCPVLMLKGVKNQLPEGSTCGGTCGTSGSCADGLKCKTKPVNPYILGAAPEGICVFPDDAVDNGLFDEATNHFIVKKALKLLNSQLNSMNKYVLWRVMCMDQSTVPEGVRYDIEFTTRPSTCRKNYDDDDIEEVDDHDCEILPGGRLQTDRLQLIDKGGSFNFLLHDLSL